MHKKRKRYRKKYNTIIGMFLLAALTIMAVGYGAFFANINLGVKGNVKEKILINEYITSLHNSNDQTLIDDNTSDHNIRYSGKDVNNYICLANENPCSENNLYRVIGVFNNIKSNENSVGETRTKIIRANVLFQSAFDDANNVNWGIPTSLNARLNSSVLASNKLIDNTFWTLGQCWIGITSNDSYECEKGTPTWTGKIVLMYQSDYGFASKSCYKTTKLWAPDTENDDYRNNECINSNWLFNTSTEPEWTLIRGTREGRVNAISTAGAIIDSAFAVPTEKNNVRPVAFLKSSVSILKNGNSSSKDKPYVIA